MSDTVVDASHLFRPHQPPEPDSRAETAIRVRRELVWQKAIAGAFQAHAPHIRPPRMLTDWTIFAREYRDLAGIERPAEIDWPWLWREFERWYSGPTGGDAA